MNGKAKSGHDSQHQLPIGTSSYHLGGPPSQSVFCALYRRVAKGRLQGQTAGFKCQLDRHWLCSLGKLLYLSEPPLLGLAYKWE